jgi:hypothetical protein
MSRNGSLEQSDDSTLKGAFRCNLRNTESSDGRPDGRQYGCDLGAVMFCVAHLRQIKATYVPADVCIRTGARTDGRPDRRRYSRPVVRDWEVERWRTRSWTRRRRSAWRTRSWSRRRRSAWRMPTGRGGRGALGGREAGREGREAAGGRGAGRGGGGAPAGRGSFVATCFFFLLRCCRRSSAETPWMLRGGWLRGGSTEAPRRLAPQRFRGEPRGQVPRTLAPLRLVPWSPAVRPFSRKTTITHTRTRIIWRSP